MRNEPRFTLFHDPDYLRSAGARLVLGFLPLLFGLLGIGCSVHLTSWKPASLLERCFKLVATEALLSLLALCVLSLVWSLFAPRWIERMFATLARRVLVTLGGIIVLSAVCAWYMMAAG